MCRTSWNLRWNKKTHTVRWKGNASTARVPSQMKRKLQFEQKVAPALLHVLHHAIGHRFSFALHCASFTNAPISTCGPSSFIYMIDAFLSVAYAPRFAMVFSARAETVSVMCLLSSGMKIFLFWRLAFRRTLPTGLYCVARVRFEYPPPTRDDLPVMAHTLAIVIGG